MSVGLGGASRRREDKACILEKEKPEHRVRVLEKLYFIYIYIYIFFFNIMLTWKIVRVSKASVLYIYIDYNLNLSLKLLFYPTNNNL